MVLRHLVAGSCPPPEPSPTLARRSLRYARVLWRLSVVLNVTWMRLARGALRFERTRLAWMRLARGALRFFERARLAAANAQAAYEKS